MSVVKRFETNPNISFYPSNGYDEVSPDSLEQLVNIVTDAFTKETKLYPISTGFNWGMGSKIPTDDECTLVNLSKLNKIVEYDEFAGTVTIEPGVTQDQLMRFLIGKGNKHYIDVTGSSKDTSIVGNALERGITYNSQRNESVLALEVVTGMGEVIRTASWRFKNTKIHSIYKHGVGANLTELFFQSNFGIVAKIIIKLHKVKRYNSSVMIQFKEFSGVTKSMSAFNELLESKTICSIFHIANSERAQGAIIPAIQKRLQEINCSYDVNELKKIVNAKLSKGWIASGFLSSDNKNDIKNKIKFLKKELSKHGKITVIDLNKLNFINKYVGALGRFNLIKLAYGVYPFKTLYLGQPTDAALGSVTDIKNYLKDDFSASNVDETNKGFAYCLPLMPMSQEHCRNAYELILKSCQKYGFIPSITLNPIKEFLLEAVISIDYEKKEYGRSRECIRELQVLLNENGYYSYRTNIKDMDLYFEDEIYLKYLRGIKKVFDPKNIISPGRYLPQEKIKIQR